MVPVVIRTRDEVGELAQSFNRTVEELRTRERIKDTFGKFLGLRLFPQVTHTLVMPACQRWHSRRQ